MCNFSKEDVVKMAKAIMDEPCRYVDGDYTPYFFCIYCNAELKGYNRKKKDFKHDINCPVLIAQDILTGNKI